ncbi:MAG: S8 family serine peptidase [Oscillospiraceae bacterium]|nr:S8 family serine peptidase [Oscillospiraceae bacterium]
MFVQKGKRSISFLCCLALLLSLVSGIPPATAESTVSKITAELQEVLDDMGDGDTVPVYVWIGDIDYDEVEEEVKEEIGFGREDFAIEQDGFSHDVLQRLFGLKDMGMPNDDSNPYAWERLVDDGYYELLEEVDTYIETERQISKGKYDGLLEDFSKKHLTDAEVIFQSYYAPMIICQTTKAGVSVLETLEQVVSMDLYQDTAISDHDLDTAISSIDGTFPQKIIGLTGKNVVIGMIESDVPKFSVQDLNGSNITRLTTNSSSTVDPEAGEHASVVAAIMVGSRGVAPDAQLIAAGMYGEPAKTTYELIEQLIIAGAEVINMSAGFEVRGGYDNFAKWVDHVSNQHNLTFVASTGNWEEDRIWTGLEDDDPYVCSPATAYNVIAVGSFNHRNTERIADDTFSTFSCYQTLPWNANKPDVIAPGEGFRVPGVTGGVSKKGTSYSAPMVTGVIAQLMQAKPDWKLRPDLIKAAIMASCDRKVRNIYGTGESLDKLTDRQGAGIVNVRNAVFSNGYTGEYEPGQPDPEIGPLEFFDSYVDEDGNEVGTEVTVVLSWFMPHEAENHKSGAVDNSSLTLSKFDLELRDNSGHILKIAEPTTTTNAVLLRFDTKDYPKDILWYTIVVKPTSVDRKERFAVAWSQPRFRNLGDPNSPSITITAPNPDFIGIGDEVTVEIKPADEKDDYKIFYTENHALPATSDDEYAYNKENTKLYTGPFKLSSGNPSANFDIPRAIMAVSVDENGEASGYGVAYVTFRYRSKSNINYDISDVVAYATSPGHDEYGINLTREALVIPNDFVPAKYSVDGGKKWKEIKPANQALDNNKNPFNHNAKKGKNNFAKLLSKNLELRISDGTQEIVFPRIQAPTKVKYAINYEHGQFATVNGDWVLTLKKENDVKKDVLIARVGMKDSYSPDKAGKELVKYDFKEGEEIPGEFAWGQFYSQDLSLPQGVVNGITLVPTTFGKVTKWPYFVRSAPSSNAAGDGDFVAAGKIQKVSPTSLRKKPALKDNKPTVKTKKGMLYSFTPAKDNTTGVPVERGAADAITITWERGIYEFWLAGGKKAPSEKQVLFLP